MCAQVCVCERRREPKWHAPFYTMPKLCAASCLADWKGVFKHTMHEGEDLCVYFSRLKFGPPTHNNIFVNRVTCVFVHHIRFSGSARFLTVILNHCSVHLACAWCSRTLPLPASSHHSCNEQTGSICMCVFSQVSLISLTITRGDFNVVSMTQEHEKSDPSLSLSLSCSLSPSLPPSSKLLFYISFYYRSPLGSDLDLISASRKQGKKRHLWSRASASSLYLFLSAILLFL